MSKVTFEVEGIKITVEKEDQGMFGHCGGYQQEDHFQYRGRYGDDFARRPYYRRGEESDDVRRPHQTNFYPSQEDWRYAVNQQYGKQSTGEPMFDEQVHDAVLDKATRTTGFADKLRHGEHHRERPFISMSAMVNKDSIEKDIATLAENKDEHIHLLVAYDKVKDAISAFIGRYILSGESVDLLFTQTDRGDYTVLLPIPQLSMGILLYANMIEKEGEYYVISINFDYQSNVEDDDGETPSVEQSAKAFILGYLKSYIERERSKHYSQPIQEDVSKQPEGQEDGNEGNSQPVGETPTSQQKDRF